MSTDQIAGLNITIVGLFIAFLFMALFILVIVVLQRLFPAKAAEEVSGEEGAESGAVMMAADENGEEQAVAAIAAALSLLRPAAQGIGAGLTEGRGPWWVEHRLYGRQDAGLQKK